MNTPHPYEAPILTIDAVVFQLISGRLHVLLIRRRRDPFMDVYALPGVYVPRSETTRQAFDRALEVKAGVDARQLHLVRQLYAFDTVARDPRGHAVSIVYLGLGSAISPIPSPTSERPEFLPVDSLPTVAFDHSDIVASAVAYLRTEIMHTNILFTLLPDRFTLTTLQAAYESILGRALDKRNFRKKLLIVDIVESTSDYRKDGAHRPAQLYRFKHSELSTFPHAFV